ncbi:ankyrin repeat-containing protein [Legionella gratiana]|uniref:Ankyrin repeat-containing protein n=1 Tax=Legionella gratiana TaxID=45066 RepID=A0A378JFF2_9GAMM|nr:Dot/Icm T4SS effector AnkQ/LegA10 [Legionella gratiana]KTD05430.1 ankyrin repeat-containing protein [Legionella gratiana]STX46056.1 ankyrin repeat-containing protein [Legionella gratiana]
MSLSESEVRKISFMDKVARLAHKPGIQVNEIEALLDEELSIVSAGKGLTLLTDLIHLVSFVTMKHFSNPISAIQLFVNENTTRETRKALITAIRMAPKEEDKIYDFICLLAQKNQLSRYTELARVSPLRFYISEEERYEYNEWYLIFDLFGLCKNIPHELIPLIARNFTITTPSAEDLLALRTFFEMMSQFHLLKLEIIEPMLPHLYYKDSIEKLQALLLKLSRMELLKPDVLAAAFPLLNHMDALNLFFTIYQEELLLDSSRPAILEQLSTYCQLSLPNKDSYDDVVPTNTPLHQAIIDRNYDNLKRALDLANTKLLLATSYENTALTLACKLADETAATLILTKMHELGCDVDQADHHGMTALHWARFYRFNNLSIDLITAGANPELMTLNGKNSEYFAKHTFLLMDFQIESGREIIEDYFKLKNSALTDVAFHAEKIALNLKLTSRDEIMALYHADDTAQLRSSNRFYLFFKVFRTRLVEWLARQNELELSPQHSIR